MFASEDSVDASKQYPELFALMLLTASGRRFLPRFRCINCGVIQRLQVYKDEGYSLRIQRFRRSFIQATMLRQTTSCWVLRLTMPCRKDCFAEGSFKFGPGPGAA